ncbi:uncharacterized protein LOC126403847 [Epinephelus moara]|uniref:uncharacterized protein LOC126403847 n=1 Tax=Epinephelus moara TaxID=300413 RepID=UPI00214E1D1E|nr:uncharacterized protein LOC126403847 [Epinephelus moara]
MKVTALCIRLLINVLLLAVAQMHLCFSQKAVFPRVDPNRQQHYQYDSFVVNCEGLDGVNGWKVMRKIKGNITVCAAQEKPSTGSCKINPAFSLDSGVYWCETEEKKSNTVNITVTAGSVVLESPVTPVMVGDAVTLHCRKKKTSILRADFYKDGDLIEGNSAGHLTLQSVFKSDEGFYKCRISQTEESAESWLAVRRFHKDLPSNDKCCSKSTILQIVGIISFVLLVLVLGLLHWKKGSLTSFLRSLLAQAGRLAFARDRWSRY